MGENDIQRSHIIAALQHAAATRYAADRVCDLREAHPDLTVSRLIAILEKDAHEALVDADTESS